MLELSNFKRAPKIEFSIEQPGRQTLENSKSWLDTQGCLELFVRNLLCMTTVFVDDK
jgi:hypothetical protein